MHFCRGKSRKKLKLNEKDKGPPPPPPTLPALPEFPSEEDAECGTTQPDPHQTGVVPQTQEATVADDVQQEDEEKEPEDTSEKELLARTQILEEAHRAIENEELESSETFSCVFVLSDVVTVSWILLFQRLLKAISH